MPDRLRHEALPYFGHEQFVASAVSVLRDALDRDERLMFLAGGAKLDDVRDGLGPDVDEVTMVATDEHGRNPSRITTMLHSFSVMDHGRRALALNETVLPGLAAPTLQEAQLAESVLNASALASWAMSIICLYDVDRLDADCRQEMRRDHPVIRGDVGPNEDYDADRLADLYRSELSPPTPSTARAARGGRHQSDQGARVRGWRGEEARSARRPGRRPRARSERDRHQQRPARRRPLCRRDVGRRGCGGVRGARSRLGPRPDRRSARAAPEAASGRGLWLANHLCDLLQIRSSPQGTAVRLVVDR